MNNVKMYFKICILSTGVGLIARLVWYVLSGWLPIEPKSVIEYAVFGLFVGSITLISLSMAIQKYSKLIQMCAMNTVIDFVLLMVIFAYQNTKMNQFDLIPLWLTILLLTETMSTLLTIYWYRQVAFYNKMLQHKKEEIAQYSKY